MRIYDKHEIFEKYIYFLYGFACNLCKYISEYIEETRFLLPLEEYYERD